MTSPVAGFFSLDGRSALGCREGPAAPLRRCAARLAIPSATRMSAWVEEGMMQSEPTLLKGKITG